MIPLVSIIMPAYNAEQYIQAAIESVRKQTLMEWELIIIDDCSIDSTFEIIKSFSDIDSRLIVIKNENNLGAAASRNKGLARSKGKYIAFLDSDDLWEETKLEKQVNCILENNADIVYCSYAIIDGEGKKRSPDFVVPQKSDFNTMLIKSTIAPSTALIRNEWTKKYHFPVNMYHEDLAYWLLLLKNGADAVGIREVLASYRVIPGSRASNKFKSALNRWRIFKSYLGFSVVRSSILLFRYSILGVAKYRKII